MLLIGVPQWMNQEESLIFMANVEYYYGYKFELVITVIDL